MGETAAVRIGPKGTGDVVLRELEAGAMVREVRLTAYQVRAAYRALYGSPKTGGEVDGRQLAYAAVAP
jgi:hypothetical protein